MLCDTGIPKFGSLRELSAWLGMSCGNKLNKSDTLTLFVCNGPDTIPAVTAAPVHAIAATMEVKGISAPCVTLVGRRTPIEAVLPNEAERGVIAITRGRQKDAVAVRPGDLVPIMSPLAGPFPYTLDHQFYQFLRCRKTPFAAPGSPGRVIARDTGNFSKIYFIGTAVVFRIARLRLYLAPGIVITVL